MEVKSTEAAVELCKQFGIQLPEAERQDAPVQPRMRTCGKVSVTALQQQQRPFAAATSFGGARPGYVFKLGAQGLGYYNDVCTE